MSRLDEIRERHEKVVRHYRRLNALGTKGAGGFAHKDRSELLKKLAAVRVYLREISDDYAPLLPPSPIEEIVEEIAEMIK